MPNPLFITKSVDHMRAEAQEDGGLVRNLGAWYLTLLGVGCTIGTGIFVLTGQAAASNAGPGIALSFVIAGFAAALAALCYSEMATMIPVAGSAYTYAYATMGELVAWMIGWDLILEYLVGAATVSVGWSGYMAAFLHDAFNINIPFGLRHAPFAFLRDEHRFVATDAYINLPAVFICLFVTFLLVRGIEESARVNAIVVCVKVAAVLLFLAFAAPCVHPALWHPFIPANKGEFGAFGISGVFQGATMVFFSYIGFDAVSTAAQEAKNPQRDLPLSMLVSLSICTVLYIAVALVLTGVVPYAKLAVAEPIALGIEATGRHWLMTMVEIGAIGGLSSVMLVLLMGQPRIFYSMAKDGLFPKIAAKLHPVHKTPVVTTIISGVVCALAGGLLPIEVLGELTSIGTLFAFVLVGIGITILRLKRPDLPRKFKVPFGPYVVPGLTVLTSGTLMATATFYTLLRLIGWMAIGLAFYAAYGRRHSKARKLAAEQGA